MVDGIVLRRGPRRRLWGGGLFEFGIPEETRTAWDGTKYSSPVYFPEEYDLDTDCGTVRYRREDTGWRVSDREPAALYVSKAGEPFWLCRYRSDDTGQRHRFAD